jgi:hypothetical protein
MTGAAEKLLAELQASGIEMLIVGDRLRWRPRGAVSPALRERIVKYKVALIALLAGPTGPKTPAAKGGDTTNNEDSNGQANRSIWVLLPNSQPQEVASVDLIPPDATAWCREGDKKWRPIGEPSG